MSGLARAGRFFGAVFLFALLFNRCAHSAAPVSFFGHSSLVFNDDPRSSVFVVFADCSVQ